MEHKAWFDSVYENKNLILFEHIHYLYWQLYMTQIPTHQISGRNLHQL